MKRLIALTLFALSVHFPLAAATPSVMDHNGVGLMYQSVDPAKKFDTSALPADQGLRNIAKALDVLMKESPVSAQKIKSLMKSGRVRLVYHPDNLRDSAAGSEAVALFRPDFLKNPAEHSRATTFIVVVGRHGVKWPTKELAAVLAHELVGHGVQHQRARLSNLRDVDAECEAYMYEEIANQDLARIIHGGAHKVTANVD
jgi:hypothetical protein